MYGRRTLAGLSRQFEPGEEVEIEIPFQQRLGGDTYRLVLNILDRSDEPLYTDPEGLLVYVPGRPGSAGLVNLEASIVVDGETVSEDAGVVLDGDRASSAKQAS